MVVRMDSAFWEFGKFYHKKHLEDHPGSGVSLGVITMGMLLALAENGDAVKHLDADGSVTWRATPKFLTTIGREAGPLVAFGPDLN
jgi:hypothetical protein